ncbi:MAG TPA: carboxypeptidase regulatory-like domain-containing protein [Bryobacteraceae bacterium]|nr:carboxypeptidase regulatory-like domain-containing protein [Bryobacteraceae bacterium]
MTWLLAIFFSRLLAGPLLGASVSGTVELTGSSVPVVRKHANYSGVVVWLEPGGVSPAAVPPQHVQMVQKHKTFSPHVLAIPVGSTVSFPNFDPIFHNAFSNYSGQVFDVGLYPPKTTRTVAFKREGVVRVFCNIHPSMSAIIIVLRTGYFAVSNSDGSFHLPGVPPGRYQVRLFHERALDETLRQLTRSITVEEEKVILPPLVITESGYLQTPHKNKFGKDYPPVADDITPYPGARK